MKISTAYFGSQEISEESIITFPRGLVGLESATRFKLFHEEGHPTVFWLQSVDDPGLALSVVQPERFDLFFELVLSDDETRLLELADPNNAEVLLVVSRDEGEGEEMESPTTGAKVRANLYGPLVLNLERRLGLQKVVQQLTQAVLIRAE